MKLKDISISNLRRRKGIGPMITGIKGGKIFIDPILAIGAIFLSAIIGVLSSAYPAIHASKMDRTTALRSL